MLELLLSALLLLAVYSYFGYPGILLIMSKGGGKPVREVSEIPSDLPRVSLIITAHNEERRIAAKLDECLRCDYPKDRLEIIVASDTSTDATDTIVREYREHGVRLVRAEERLGKENAQSIAIGAANGDVLVFSDVGTTLLPDAVTNIVAPFADPEVGAVSSEDSFLTQDGSIAGEGLYVRYEMWLRRLESRVFSLVGLSGSFFAVRRDVCTDWDITVPSDFNVALNAVGHGLKAVSSPQARGYYHDVKDPKAEYSRKVRTVLRGMAALAKRSDVLNPRRFGLFSWQVWSHKVARWATPWFLALLFIVSAIAGNTSGFAAILLGGQLMFYGAALVGYFVPAAQSIAAVRIAFFFCQANIAIMHATLRYLKGERVTVWKPTRR